MKIFIISLILIFASCSSSSTKNLIGEDKKLNDLFTKHWEANMERYPEWSTWVNYKDGIYNDRWSEVSFEAVEESKKFTKEKLNDLKTINQEKLSDRWSLYYTLYLEDLKEGIEGDQFPGHLMVISQLGGFQQGIATMLNQMPKRKKQDYENLLKRLEGVPQKIEGHLKFLKEGLKKGITPPKVTLSDIPNQFDAMLEKDFTKNPLVKSFQKYPDFFTKEEKQSYTERAKKLLAKIHPVFKEAKRFVVEEYIPGCRKDVGFSSLPNGLAWYNYNIKSYTTLDKTADEIHQIGLSEVKRIKTKMLQVIKDLKYQGDFTSFLTHLRTHPKFFYKKREDLLRDYRAIAKKADGRLLKVFKTLPKTPYGVEPTPSYMEKSAPTAYYYSGNLEAGKPGLFYANTYNLKARPKWEMVPLTLHEAMPGHHLQIMIAMEQEAKPELIKNSGYTGFVEGWGLYAESLGEDMEMYEDLHDKFGQLTYEMWRAIRLVVDTGIHAKGWSRQKAIDYFLANAPKTKHDVTVEVDRYISWPGQALAYKLGELKFKELRELARKTLGDKFDVREYHHQALKEGALPLSVLDQNIHEWLEKINNEEK